ncbi:hypothetical protein CRYUN_Cryun19dG0038100 [Craigia yunnanensis]
MLTINNDEFWEGVSPVEFGELPALQDAVTVVGYPIGGDTISVTSGVVSRIEILSYVHGSAELLDAAINSGNFGGPAFKIKAIVWAFQSLKHEDAENIGRVDPTAPESGVLKSSDIMLSFDGLILPMMEQSRKDYEYEAPVKLLDKLLHSMPQSPDEQLVVVSQVLVADINIGYEDIVNTQVLAFNGKPVKNLKSFTEMVENYDDEFLKFDLEYEQIVVHRAKTAKAASPDILATHCILSAV